MPFFLLVSFSGILFLICTTGILLRTFLLVVTVQYSSMSPTLEHGDRVIAMRKTPKSWLYKGRIVLIWPVPGIRIPVPASYQEPPYIKRIVAVSSETYMLAPDEKRVSYLKQGTTISSETFVSTPDGKGLSLISPDHPKTWDIPAKHVFVRGDNREGSIDSAIWGPVPFRNILAVVLMKLPGKAEPAHAPLASLSEQFANNPSAIRLVDSE